MGENWLKVVRVDCSIASIPPFGIDIPLYSESVQSKCLIWCQDVQGRI